MDWPRFDCLMHDLISTGAVEYMHDADMNMYLHLDYNLRLSDISLFVDRCLAVKPIQAIYARPLDVCEFEDKLKLAQK